MGQKISPIGFRTGITIGWKSRWYAPKSNFGEFLVEDERIRRYIDQQLNRKPPYAAISAIEIERTREEVKIQLKTARPGLVIGPKGAEVDKLRQALEDLTDRRVNINIVEIKNPDLDAQLVAEGISEQLKRRAGFRRVLKQRAEGAMQAGAKGVKIQVSGRLGGAEMGRTQTVILGSIPLHTLEADVDFGFTPCFTTYGSIGVKVWIYRGLFGGPQAEGEEPTARAMTRGRRRHEGAAQRTGGGGRGRGRGQSAGTAAAGGKRSRPVRSKPTEEAKRETSPAAAGASQQKPGAAAKPEPAGGADEQSASEQPSGGDEKEQQQQ